MSVASGSGRQISGVLVTVVLAVLVTALLADVSSASETPRAHVYVDCAADAGGSGDKKAPFSTITAALPSARNLARERIVTIEVAEGVCGDEQFPIALDFPVTLRGSRSPAVDAGGMPLDGQAHDTLVTWAPLSPVPPSVANLAFLRITSPGVRISRLSLDARIVPGTRGTFAPAAPAPMGVLVERAGDFVLDQLRIVRVGVAVRANGSTGRVRDTYFGTVGDAIAITGGDVAAPPTVDFTGNRIEDYWTGGVAIGGTGPAGQSARAVVEGNDMVTSYADTGPSNPFAMRIAPVLLGSLTQGTVAASFRGNRVRGTPRYAIIVNGGRTVRRSDGQRYSGVLDLAFEGNAVNEAGVTRATSLISFTNSRATELPCELDPANPKSECPTLMGNPLQYWEYLEVSRFDLHHTGELDGALVDHPEVEPVDGRVLTNQLVVNDEIADHQTFVAVP